MALMTLSPTRADKALSHAIARHTEVPIEGIMGLVTWGADEKLLLAAATAGWLYSLVDSRVRPLATHFLAVSVASAVLPHVLKHAVDQTRPDRLTVMGHARGVPFSGKARDAFPSGHAFHMGALFSAAGLLPPRARQVARAFALLMSATRIIILAHWASDVVAGFALGGILERLLRPFTLAYLEERQ